MIRRFSLVLVAALAVLFTLPELPRYAGERRLRVVDATRVAIARHATDPAPLLRRLSDDAAATWTYPDDWRPLVAAGRASYDAGDAAQAVTLFERANAFGERPEIDVNLGMALLQCGEAARAQAMFARAVALSPALAIEIDRLQRRGTREAPRR